MKKYIQPQIEIDGIKDDFMKHNTSHKPGWGPNKDSNSDGHDTPPGQRPHSDDYFIDECFEVL